MPEKTKLPEYASYSAGATRTHLKVFSAEERGGRIMECRLFAKRSAVGKYEGPNCVFVFVNQTCGSYSADVAVILTRGYGFARHGPIDPIVWAESSAPRESGVLMVVPFGFEYIEFGYKHRRPPRYFRVTPESLVDITAEVAAGKQQPI